MGFGLLGVFVIANEAIIDQTESSIESIEAKGNILATDITFANANLDEDALLDFDTDAVGDSYVGNGIISATGGGGSGFSATYTVDGFGSVRTLTIVSNGVGYTSTPTLAITGDSDMSGTDATFTNIDLGNALFANLTNEGDYSVDVDDMWISVDGDQPERLSPNSYSAFGTFFPTETIAIIYLEGGASSTVTSLSITANGSVKSSGV